MFYVEAVMMLVQALHLNENYRQPGFLSDPARIYSAIRQIGASPGYQGVTGLVVLNEHNDREGHFEVLNVRVTVSGQRKLLQLVEGMRVEEWRVTASAEEVEEVEEAAEAAAEAAAELQLPERLRQRRMGVPMTQAGFVKVGDWSPSWDAGEPAILQEVLFHGRTSVVPSDVLVVSRVVNDNLMAIFRPILIALGVIVGTTFLCVVNRYIQGAFASQKREMERKLKRCVSAIESVTKLQSPAYLISCNDFKQLGELIPHEEARAKGKLHTIDEYEELVQFALDNPVVFFSHQWLAFAKPDPDRIQYQEMVAACITLCEQNGFDPSDLYIFLDFISIPQKNATQQLNAIATLGISASLFRYFVIITPTAVHKDTLLPCDKDSYARRGWCRLEQWGHLCTSGINFMYYYNNGKLEPLADLGDNWFLDSIMVLGGDYTKPECKGELVDTILGLYVMVMKGRFGTTSTLYALIEKHFEQVCYQLSTYY